MDGYIEETVSTGLNEHIKVRGKTDQAVIRMIWVLKDFEKQLEFDLNSWLYWQRDKPVEDFTEHQWDMLSESIVSIN